MREILYNSDLKKYTHDDGYNDIEKNITTSLAVANMRVLIWMDQLKIRYSRWLVNLNLDVLQKCEALFARKISVGINKYLLSGKS